MRPTELYLNRSMHSLLIRKVFQKTLLHCQCRRHVHQPPFRHPNTKLVSIRYIDMLLKLVESKCVYTKLINLVNVAIENERTKVLPEQNLYSHLYAHWRPKSLLELHLLADRNSCQICENLNLSEAVKQQMYHMNRVYWPLF